MNTKKLNIVTCISKVNLPLNGKKAIWSPLVWIIITLVLLIVVAVIIGLASGKWYQLLDAITRMFGG